MYVIQQLLQEEAVEPTKCTELMTVNPLYMSFIDASGVYCGGVYMGDIEELETIVWRNYWIPDIKIAFITHKSQRGHYKFQTCKWPH